jgi:hypothetical protein
MSDVLDHHNILRSQERLQRKRYIDDAFVDVRAALPCCKPPDLHCSRYMRRSGTFWDGVIQRLGTYISRPSSQRTLTYRNWTS